MEHRPSTTPRYSILFWAALAIPDQLVPCCFSSASVSRLQLFVARPASLPLPLRVPGQGLACDAGCWLPEGVSDPAPLPPQHLLGHWFLSRSHTAENTQFTVPWDCLLVGCLTSQQQASVSQGRICSDNFTCCHTEIEVADPTFYLTQSQYPDTGPTSPSADPITPGAWQGSHWSANF